LNLPARLILWARRHTEMSDEKRVALEFIDRDDVEVIEWTRTIERGIHSITIRAVKKFKIKDRRT
jgi:hypothetical protein